MNIWIIENKDWAIYELQNVIDDLHDEHNSTSAFFGHIERVVAKLYKAWKDDTTAQAAVLDIPEHGLGEILAWKINKEEPDNMDAPIKTGWKTHKEVYSEDPAAIPLPPELLNPRMIQSRLDRWIPGWVSWAVCDTNLWIWKRYRVWRKTEARPA